MIVCQIASCQAAEDRRVVTTYRVSGENPKYELRTPYSTIVLDSDGSRLDYVCTVYKPIFLHATDLIFMTDHRSARSAAQLWSR